MRGRHLFFSLAVQHHLGAYALIFQILPAYSLTLQQPLYAGRAEAVGFASS